MSEGAHSFYIQVEDLLFLVLEKHAIGYSKGLFKKKHSKKQQAANA